MRLPGKLLPLFLMLVLAACATTPPRGASTGPIVRPPVSAPVPRGPVSDTPVKIGKPYQVAGQWYSPADDAQYDEVGYASWYGDAFHGGPTANGEVYDMDMVGAAHKTLPLPSYVEVTALDTGRTILVRVNDRGPFVTNRIIDLSRRSAVLLGTARQGVARVRVRRVFPSDADRLALRSGKPASDRAIAPTTELAALDTRFQSWLAVQAPPPPPPPTGNAASLDPSAIGGWFVQLGAYGDRARADSLAGAVGGNIDTAGNLYRVRLGPYFDEQIAMAALARAQGQGYQDAKLIPPRSSN